VLVRYLNLEDLKRNQAKDRIAIDRNEKEELNGNTVQTKEIEVKKEKGRKAKPLGREKDTTSKRKKHKGKEKHKHGERHKKVKEGAVDEVTEKTKKAKGKLKETDSSASPQLKVRSKKTGADNNIAGKEKKKKKKDKEKRDTGDLHAEDKEKKPKGEKRKGKEAERRSSEPKPPISPHNEKEEKAPKKEKHGLGPFLRRTTILGFSRDKAEKKRRYSHSVHKSEV